jgi:hypothetical protein
VAVFCKGDDGEVLSPVSSSLYVKEAIKGFAESICLGEKEPIASVLQDTLRLLTLWFTYGQPLSRALPISPSLARLIMVAR